MSCKLLHLFLYFQISSHILFSKKGIVTNFLRTIILLGVLQGFIVSYLLYSTSKGRSANKLLAVFLALLSLASFNLYSSYYNWYGSGILRFVAALLPWVIAMPFGPLFYFYIRSFLDSGFTITKQRKWQFATIVVDLVPALIAQIYVIGVLLNVIPRKPAPWVLVIDTYNVYSDIPRWLSLAWYVFLSARYLKQYQQENSTTPGLAWLKQMTSLMLIFLGIWFLFLVPYIIPEYTDRLLGILDWYPIYLPMTVLIYWFGIKGLIMSYQETGEKKPANILSKEQAGDLLLQLERVMEQEQLYLDAELSLTGLAKHIGVPPKQLSAVLNQHLGKNFNEFVNEYRIELFKEKLLNSENETYTITSIAYDCGFSSQATFQRAFKQVTGLSPTAFKKEKTRYN